MADVYHIVVVITTSAHWWSSKNHQTGPFKKHLASTAWCLSANQTERDFHLHSEHFKSVPLVGVWGTDQKVQ